jgi:hypothetical protein
VSANGRVMDDKNDSVVEYLRKRAAEARAKAEGMARDDARRIVLEVADMWDRLAASVAKENEPPSTDPLPDFQVVPGQRGEGCRQRAPGTCCGCLPIEAHQS